MSIVAVPKEDEVWLRSHAWRMWRYFREFSTARRNWLIPDHVSEDGVVAERLSPTNLGFLLNARIAAVHLGHHHDPAERVHGVRPRPTRDGWAGSSTTRSTRSSSASMWVTTTTALPWSRQRWQWSQKFT